MKLDAVQSAMQAKLEVEMKPVTDQLSRLRAALDAYEVVLRQDVERRVNNTILVALGQDPLPELEDLKRAQGFLLEAMSGMTVTIDPSAAAPPSTPEHVPVALPPKAVPASSQPSQTDRIQIAPVIPPSESFATLLTQGAQLSSTRRQLRRIAPEDVTDAKRLLAEVEGLRKTFKTQHTTRLFPLLQAIAAETRILLERFPQDHHYAEKLQEIIPTLGRLKHEGGVQDFIKGLAFGSSGSWPSIATTSRRKVQQFDKDAETPPSSTKKPPPSAKKIPSANAQHAWPELPHLRKLEKPILLAGGMFIPEKVTSIYERFGLNVEWHAIDHNNPKAQGPLLTRIRGQKLGAVILLEGFMRHDAFKPIAEACSTSFVPMAYGDKAGVASLASAFDELEKKLAPRKEGAA